MTKYLYLIDNEPTLGDIQKYAHDFQSGALCGVEVSRKVTPVYNGEPDMDVPSYGTPFRPIFEPSAEHDDLVSVIVYGEGGKFSEDRGYYTVDLRA